MGEDSTFSKELKEMYTMEKIEFWKKVKQLYEINVSCQIEIEELKKGNVIEKLAIDSLIALRLIIEIERCFGIVIDEDDIAIQMIDNPVQLLDVISKQ